MPRVYAETFEQIAEDVGFLDRRCLVGVEGFGFTGIGAVVDDFRLRHAHEGEGGDAHESASFQP